MVLIGFILTTLFGWSILRLFNQTFSNRSKFFLSFLLGLGIQTLLMFYLAVLEIKLTLFSVTFLISAITALFLLLKPSLRFKFSALSLRDYIQKRIKSFQHESTLNKIFIIFFAGLAIYVLLAGFYWPVVGWDSIALYDFRAKVFADTGFMEDAIRRGYFFGYPLMTSMAHTWSYLLGWSYPKFIYALMYLGMGSVFYDITKRWSDRLTSNIFTLLLLMAPQIFGHAAFDYTNLPYTVYFFISSVFLILGINKRNYSLIILSSIFMGIATWVRSTDPFWVVNIVVLVISSIYQFKNIKAIALYFLFFFPIQQSWSLYLSKMAPHVSTGVLFEQSLSVATSRFDPIHFLKVVTFVIGVIGPSLFLYFLLAVVSIVVDRKNIINKKYLYLLILGNSALLFVGAYIFSFIYPGWSEIGESLGRMVYIYIPLFLILSASNLKFGKIIKSLK